MATEENKLTLPSKSNSELGYSGTVISSGIISNEDYNRNLKGIAGNHKFEIMRRSDSTIRSALQIVKLPLLSTKWKVEPVTDADGNIDEADQKKADFINNELFNRNINFKRFLKQALSHFDFGFSVFEKVFELTVFEGEVRIGIKKLASRKQSSIAKWETDDNKEGIVQLTSSGDRASIPREKLLIFSHDREGDNYEGTSLLRYVYKEWDLKDKLIIVNAIALEKLGVGVPVITEVPGVEATAGDEEKAIEALTNMRANNRSYMKLPNSIKIEMLDLKGNTTKDIEPFLTYLDGRIMTAILARFMEIGGASGSGSQSLSKDLSSLFMKSEEAVAEDIAATMFDDLIKQLCDINYSDNTSGYPKLTFGTIADDDNTAIATGVSSLVTSGAMTPNIELENNMRERFRIAKMSEEDYDEAHQAVDAPIEDTSTTDSKKTATPPANKAATDKAKKDTVEASIEGIAEHRETLLLALQG